MQGKTIRKASTEKRVLASAVLSKKKKGRQGGGKNLPIFLQKE